jgi:hypothetical protein
LFPVLFPADVQVSDDAVDHVALADPASRE